MTTTTVTTTPVLTTLEERALKLLGSGVSQESTALALGVTASTISQLMADETFANMVAEQRFKNLQSYNERDNKLDLLEDAIINRLEKSIALTHKPMELTRMLQVVNGAKRRGASAPESILEKTTVVQLVLPTVIKNTFAIQTNLANQVTKINDTDLLTIQSGTLLSNIKREHEVKENEQGSSEKITRVESTT
jgi:hypothetical protein